MRLFLFVALLLSLPCTLRSEEAANRTVFAGVIVKNYDQLIPLFLKSIHDLDYDKKLIQIQFDLTSTSEETKKALSEWSLKNKSSYQNITTVHHNLPAQQSYDEKNRFFGEIKDGYLAKAKELNTSYCFILSSDVFLLPRTLKHLIEQDKPIIAPLLRPIPEAADLFRNFFADITESGYYKEHPVYGPIAHRQSLGTFKVPCVSFTYLIKSDLCQNLSFTKNFSDWDFLAFSKNARESQVDQYICNEREFGGFLHFYKELSEAEEKTFSLIEPEVEITPDSFQAILSPYYPNDPSLKKYAAQFNLQDYALYRVQNQDLFYVDEVNDYIKSYIIKQGLRWEEFIHDQFKKYVKPGSVALDIGGHIGTHTLNLSRIVGESGKVHVFEPQAKMFCELALNMHLNHCQNVVLHHTL